MRTLILDGTWPNDPHVAQVHTALRHHLGLRGWNTEHILLREQKISNCAGDFFCWVKTPGICIANDANRMIAAAIVRSDLMIYLTPITFGGYSSALKRMIDHQIQNISPYFTTIGGETHHKKRYKYYPSMLVIGWHDQPDAHSEAIFGHLAHRNAINMHAPSIVYGTINPNLPLSTQIQTWLTTIEQGISSPPPSLPSPQIAPASTQPLRHATLLVGSPRGSASTSAALGEYLMEQLVARGVTVQQFSLYRAMSNAEQMQELLTTLDQTDLVVLSFPLYIDSLPGPVIATLEQIAAHRRGRAGNQQRLAAIANCGFPEAHHNQNALAVCEVFARETGFAWAGGLALGEGAGMINGQPLKQLGMHIAPIRRVLSMAASGLVDEGTIPAEAADLMAQPIIPPWLYTMVGGLNWERVALEYGATHAIGQQPYTSTEYEERT
ncbi:NAD(P)H-dependent oxidoreductase [Candidatus Oscillochloris fontis]|uniref:NAD(P)H-dependent oxidoreductase n=1 Tax=Candidatus Oscillochloris fontis TaxID=2496868 RepID=UPI00101C8A3D|nr:NAD(P)H-dependent oxidoreductase [Candidatus Oscillochloris fontis]